VNVSNLKLRISVGGLCKTRNNSRCRTQTGLKKWSVSMSINMNCLTASRGTDTGLAHSISWLGYLLHNQNTQFDSRRGQRVFHFTDTPRQAQSLVLLFSGFQGHFPWAKVTRSWDRTTTFTLVGVKSECGHASTTCFHSCTLFHWKSLVFFMISERRYIAYAKTAST